MRYIVFSITLKVPFSSLLIFYFFQLPQTLIRNPPRLLIVRKIKLFCKLLILFPFVSTVHANVESKTVCFKRLNVFMSDGNLLLFFPSLYNHFRPIFEFQPTPQFVLITCLLKFRRLSNHCFLGPSFIWHWRVVKIMRSLLSYHRNTLLIMHHSPLKTKIRKDNNNSILNQR